MTAKKVWWRLSFAGVVVVAAGVGAWLVLTRPHGGMAVHAGTEAALTTIPVKVIRPKIDPNLRVNVTQPCYVHPYYRASVEARVSGPILQLHKDIGNKVRAGEELITIDVPDLVADVAQKDATIRERLAAVEVAKALSEKAKADVEIARSNIRQKDSEVQAADAETAYRKQELERFREMASRGTVLGNVVAEREKFTQAAQAAGLAARAAVDKAKADLTGAFAKVKEAAADERYREELVAVARRDRDVAAAKLGYATLRAPFDGILTQRLVDPGSFVQSSATGHDVPLLTVERSDIVTLSMSLPDNYAPYVTPDTEAVIEMSELPDVVIEGKVSRFSKSLITTGNDRTMRVEVDLWNRPAGEYEPFIQKERAQNRAGLKGGVEPVLPVFRDRGGAETSAAPLTPGMYGTMRLALKRFANAPLVRSSAVFSRGGKPYLFLVHDGVARPYPIEVQVDDGTLALVRLAETVNGKERKRYLTKDDVVIVTNQGELSDGQAVKATPIEW